MAQPVYLRWEGNALVDQVIRCADCHVPVLEVKSGSILLLSRHHGEQHLNTIRVITPLDSTAGTVHIVEVSTT